MLAIVLIVTTLFLVFIFMLKLEIEIKVIIKNGTNYSFLIIRLLRGLIRLRLNLSLCPDKNKLFNMTIRKTDSSLQKTAEPEDVLFYIKKAAAAYKRHKKSLAYMASKVQFTNLSVLSKIGTGDAAATALLTGSFYSLFYIMVYFFNSKFPLKKQKILVLPFYQGSLFDLDLDCIIDFKLGDIIITGINILVQKLKGGDKSVGASN